MLREVISLTIVMMLLETFFWVRQGLKTLEKAMRRETPVSDWSDHMRSVLWSIGPKGLCSHTRQNDWQPPPPLPFHPDLTSILNFPTSFSTSTSRSTSTSQNPKKKKKTFFITTFCRLLPDLNYYFNYYYLSASTSTSSSTSNSQKIPFFITTGVSCCLLPDHLDKLHWTLFWKTWPSTQVLIAANVACIAAYCLQWWCLTYGGADSVNCQLAH